MIQNTYHEPNTSDAKFKVAVEEEKLHGRKRPAPRPPFYQPGLPYIPKYVVGDYLAYATKGGDERVAKCTEVRIFDIGVGWKINYRVGTVLVTDDDIVRKLVEAP